MLDVYSEVQRVQLGNLLREKWVSTGEIVPLGVRSKSDEQ